MPSLNDKIALDNALLLLAHIIAPNPSLLNNSIIVFIFYLFPHSLSRVSHTTLISCLRDYFWFVSLFLLIESCTQN